MIQKLSLTCSLIFSLLIVNAQQKSWVELMMSDGANYDEVIKAYNDYWQGKEKVSHSGHKQFERWLQHIEPRVQEDGSIQSIQDIMFSAKQYHSKTSSRSTNGNWIEIGPWQEENYSRGVGRLSHIAFHLTNKNKMFISSPAGGIWMTENNGKSWSNVDNDLPNFGVSYIHIDASNPMIMYAATGDINANETDGAGVYKSIDGGVTWLPSNKGIEDQTVGKVMEIPGQSGHLICITKQGVYKSIDSGANWTKKSVTRDFRDLEMKPNDSNVWYASEWTASSLASYIYVSKDKGETWVLKNFFNGVFPDTRFEIEISEAEPNRLYLMGGNRMYYSDNDGDTVIEMHRGGQPFMVNYDNQGWYNASFEISNTDPNIMFSGNVRKYISYNKGLSWLRLNHTHSDNHYITYGPDKKTLYVLDDGGVHRSFDNGRSFEDLTNMGIGAIYSVAQSPFNSNHTLTGYQDCGSKYYDGQKWTSVYGADGMQALFDHFDSTRFYTGFQYGGIVRHLKHIGSSQNVPKPDNDYRRSWVTPYLLDAFDPETMYCGGEYIWRTNNLHEEKTKNIEWTKISNGFADNPNGDFLKIKLHRTNYARMFALRRNSARSRTTLIKCDNIYDSILVWDDLGANYPFSRLSSDFETDPFDSLSIYLLSNNDVLVSRDGGQSFNNISGSLPDVPVHTIKLDTVTRDLYLGSHAGVFYRGANDTDWTPFSSGLSKNARVRDIDIYYHPTDHKLSKLKAATYGRGLWESELADGAGIPERVSTYITSDHKPFSYENEYEIRVEFRQHVNPKNVNGFNASDFNISNGRIISVQRNVDFYDIEIEANNFGWVTVSVKDSAATDMIYNLPTQESKEWKINYVGDDPQFGFEGPGGVGDSSTVLLWMRADNLMLNDVGDTVSQDGEKISRWNNFMGKDYFATQGTDSSMPFYRTDTAGINGWPAVEFIPPNRFIRVENVTPVGENLSVFAVAKSNQENYVGHAWIANSRGHNGFLLHNNNNSKSVYGVTVDQTNRNVGTPSLEVIEPSKQHIFGLQANFGKWSNKFQIDNQTTYDYITQTYSRDGNDTIAVRFGKDNWNRFGDGRLSEFVYFKEDVLEAKRIIVANYLATKYDVDLKQDQRYYHAESHPFEVAGLGKIDEKDYHADAKGTGEIRVVAGADLNADEFLMWGHNDGSLSNWSEIKDLQEEKLEVLDRSWKISERGDVGLIDLRIEKTELPSVSGKVGLIMAQMADYSDAVILELTDNGTYYSVAVNLQDNAYISFVTAEDFTIGKEEMSPVSNWNLYPNPVENGFTNLSFVSGIHTEASLLVYNQIGGLVEQKNLSIQAGENSFSLEVSSYSTGVYFIQLKGEGLDKVFRMVK